MRIKLDENLPHQLGLALSQFGHEVDTVTQEGLSKADDDTVWQAVQRARRFLITQDLDFSDISRFQPGTHEGLMLVRLHQPGRNALVKKLQAIFSSENVESWERCFVVVTDHKIRVRRPPGFSQVKH